MAVSTHDGSYPPARGPGAPNGNELRTVGPQYTTVTRNATSPRTDLTGLTNGVVATLAKGDKVFIQNLNDEVLKIKKGASAAAASFDYVLAACATDDDGTGGVIEITDFEGDVSVFAASTYRFIWHKSAA